MSVDWAFPPVPTELKALAPYFQRAQELRVKDAVMAYWCTYYAAKQGISSKSQSKEVRPFLYHVMTILESMKINLENNDAVSDDDAGAAYIENFAVRVFNMADNEDRKEMATRSTAKKFLASANFFELLHLFDKPVGADIEEKIRYAKWKAADLAKAFREGRKPTPGDANAPPPPTPPLPLPTESTSPPVLPTVLEPPQDFAPSMSAWSPETSVAPSPAVRGMESLEPSPVPGTNIPLPQTSSDGSTSGSSPARAPASLTQTEDELSPATPISSPRTFGAQLDLNHNGYVTPGMWSTMATPGTEDVFKVGDAMGGISESPSVRAAARRNGGAVPDADAYDADADVQDDAWSTVENRSISRQNSWTVTDGVPTVPEGAMPPPASGLGLGIQSDKPPPPVVPVKKVHFSPSVVGGLSSASSSVAGSSPPASPEQRYAPSLPTVQEAAYSSDSDREMAHHASAPHMHISPSVAAMQPLPESGSSSEEAEVSDSVQVDGDGSPQGVPPVIQKVPSPNASPSQFPSSPYDAPQAPQFLAASPQFPSAPPQLPSSPPQLPSAPPQLPSAPPQFPSSPPQFPLGTPQFPLGTPQFPLGTPQFPSAPPQAPWASPQLPPPPAQPPTAPPHSPSQFSTYGLSPQPPAPPALHPTPRYLTTPLAPPRSPSPPLELSSTQISRIQKHCRFAISALDYEDAETARNELRAALEMLGG